MAYAHERSFAPVHDRIPYVPFGTRQPIKWPEGSGVTVWVVPNVEHYEYLPPTKQRQADDPYPRSPHPDVRKYAYHDFGNRVGFWRMLEVLENHSVPCTVSLNVAVLDHYPAIGRVIRDLQWDIMSHGLYNTRFLTGMDEPEERDFLVACSRVLARHTGRHFHGMLGPYITGTGRTPDLMAELGMRYHADWVHDDQPSPLVCRSSARMVALPYSYDLNDAPLLMRSAVEGEEYAARCIANFTRLLQEVRDDGRGRMMCLPLHPFAIGQPHRIRHLSAVLAHLRHHGAWIATATSIVDHYLEHYYDEDLALAYRTHHG